MGAFAYSLRRSIQDNGNPERAKQLRTLLSRYVNLAWVLALRPRCADLQVRLSAERSKEDTAEAVGDLLEFKALSMAKWALFSRVC